MKRMIRGAVIAAGSLALAGGTVAAGALPANADVTVNGAYGASAGGTVFLYPVANATVGNSPEAASSANIAGLLATGPILDRADPVKATSIVSQGATLTLPNGGLLQVSGLRSWCTIVDDGDDVIGGVQIFGGSITYLGQSRFTIPLPTRPVPDDTITLPNGAGTITLNDQTDDDGENGYAAIYADLTDGQSVVLGVSGCYVDEG